MCFLEVTLADCYMRISIDIDRIVSFIETAEGCVIKLYDEVITVTESYDHVKDSILRIEQQLNNEDEDWS